MQIFGVTGESLGTIGPQSEERQDEPQWKRALAAKPSVSVRRGIVWGSSPPTEPTSTLVLTSSKAYFIDIRFSMTGPEPTSPPHYWAFGGIATSAVPSTMSPQPDPHAITFPCSMHTIWTRYLDSGGDLTTPDSGTMFLLHDGSTLEIGESHNPETGVLQSYQELWTSPPSPDLYDDSLGILMPSSAQHRASPPAHRPHSPTSIPLTNQPKTKVVLAFLHRPPAPSTQPKGMILRIGEYCQGIVEIPTTTTSLIDDRTMRRQPREETSGFVRVERWVLQHPPNPSSSSSSLFAQTEEKERPSADQTSDEEGEERGDGEEGVWIRDQRSDYTGGEAGLSGIWMPCLWVCSADANRKPKGKGKGKGRRVGDRLDNGEAGGGESWRVVEAEGW